MEQSMDSVLAEVSLTFPLCAFVAPADESDEGRTPDEEDDGLEALLVAALLHP